MMGKELFKSKDNNCASDRLAKGSPPPFFASNLKPSLGLLTAARLHKPRPARLLEKPPGSPRQRVLLQGLGVETIGDLLEYLPFRYEDHRQLSPLNSLREGEVTVVAYCNDVRYRPTRNPKIRITEGSLRDASLSEGAQAVKAIWFNQPWILKQLKGGQWLRIIGQAACKNNRWEIRVTSSEQGSSSPQALSPIYPGNDQLSSSSISNLIRRVLEQCEHIIDPLPVRYRRGYISKPDACRIIHAPDSSDQALEARKRLAWDELLIWSIGQEQRSRLNQLEKRAGINLEQAQVSQWHQALPWPLTQDQKDSIQAIDQDLAGGNAMNRLVMGEVGSGKTLLAAHTMLRVAEAGGQAVLLAPTETLAEQHWLTIQNLLSPVSGPLSHLSPVLFTGSLSLAERRGRLARIEDGSDRIIIGTHALLGEVSYSHLALIVIDEQHRFGVAQRAQLALRDPRPHVLHMSATPIPRSLALTVYGDLTISTLRHKPAGRPSPKTWIASSPRQQLSAWDKARNRIAQGEQVFVVCPMIQPFSENEDQQGTTDLFSPGSELWANLTAAETEWQRVQAEEFPHVEVVLMHGKMDSPVKREAMQRFSSGQARVMVATTVIEVGVDVPNATMIIIHNAERYGIAQLHQLRGRVGRGEKLAECVLFGRGNNSRLQSLAASGDGFWLAEQDLKQRGFGELLGTRQHGLSGFRIARLPEDEEQLVEAREAASLIIAEDLLLESPEHWWIKQLWGQAYGDTG
jgi:ATP-dependent DNA helicase RecG